MNLTYATLCKMSSDLPPLVNFGRKEVEIVRDVWHTKIEKLLFSINEPIVEGCEEITCDFPKYQLEEAQALNFDEKELKFI